MWWRDHLVMWSGLDRWWWLWWWLWIRTDDVIKLMMMWLWLWWWHCDVMMIVMMWYWLWWWLWSDDRWCDDVNQMMWWSDHLMMWSGLVMMTTVNQNWWCHRVNGDVIMTVMMTLWWCDDDCDDVILTVMMWIRCDEEIISSDDVVRTGDDWLWWWLWIRTDDVINDDVIMTVMMTVMMCWCDVMMGGWCEGNDDCDGVMWWC
jgi:hypothetical protein